MQRPSTNLLPLLLLLLFAAVSSRTPSPHIVSPASSPVSNHTRTIAPTTSPSPTSSPKPPSNATAPHPKTTVRSTTLDPKQLTALESLNLIPTTHDPCIQPSFHNSTLCDSSSPFRHLIALRLSNCSGTAATTLSATALKSLLGTLRTLSFLNCPAVSLPPHFLPPASSPLTTFSATHSLHRISSGFLSRLTNLTELTVSNTPVNASGVFVILGNLKKLRLFTLSNVNLTGVLPKHWHPNITHVDLSGNRIKGNIPGSITLLENLQSLDLSSNSIDGEIPSGIGDLITLKNLSLRGNSLSGQVPDTLAAIPGLVLVDLGENQLNGTVPGFFSAMKGLKYLNLEKNNLHGVMPFNESFIRGLEVFKIGENSNLCYNHSKFVSKSVNLGIAVCDKHGLPMSPPPSKQASSPADDSGDYSDGDSSDSTASKSGHHHGPNKFVMGVAIALSSIVFLIVFVILLSKCCR